MKVFICHSTKDADFVLRVASHLRTSCAEVFYFEEHQRSDQTFVARIGEAQQRCDYMVVFVGAEFSRWQEMEVSNAVARESKPPQICVVRIGSREKGFPAMNPVINNAWSRYDSDPNTGSESITTAQKIMGFFGRPLMPFDGLPYNPNLFFYEKDIIAFYTKMILSGNPCPPSGAGKVENAKQVEIQAEIQNKILDGCPSEWPSVTRWVKPGSQQNPENALVLAAALDKYHKPETISCMLKNKLCFPEARPAKDLYFQDELARGMRVAILVAGGIAPGINSVIDGIVQRHWKLCSMYGGYPLIDGIITGLNAFDLEGGGVIRGGTLVTLAPSLNALESSKIPHGLLHAEKMFSEEHSQEGGSIIGTSRVDELIKNKELFAKVANALINEKIKILYVIGGDGSMRFAHGLWQFINNDPGNTRRGRNLSVVAVPKTMDNDILWMWQSFGFMSAVEKAREILSNLDTEVKSNPRLCILQLFGSDSGFVVSHTVAASGSGQCDVALIPEVKFSLRELGRHLRKRMCARLRSVPSAIVPSGLVVMAETAIPTDAICYINTLADTPKDFREDYEYIFKKIDIDEKELVEIIQHINLSGKEKESIYEFHLLQRKNQRIQGQTSDTLRNAGIKIVSRGLQKLLILPDPQDQNPLQPDWNKLRILANEPRHVLRAIAPTCSDIIIGQRLGTLAVDNALAGYTDFMISQWLTEYVLVPLQLVVLGRKRIPMKGMFWESVLAKTGQPDDLDIVGEYPKTGSEPAS
jgi:6-phosphofructokinase